MSTPAPACLRAIKDANQRWPSRRRDSDGILGDARHQKRKSDHNLGNAFDITHDPASGCDGSTIAQLALGDPRVKYVIWNRRIWNRERGDTDWRSYKGSNPHTHHCHVSIYASSRSDTRPWRWSGEGVSAQNVDTPKPQTSAPSGAAAPSAPSSPPSPAPSPKRPPAPSAETPKPVDKRAFPGVTLRRGARGELVKLVQERLRRLRWDINIDGIFGDDTERFIRAFQRRRGLEVDGIVARRTWNALFG
jgi:hypothetical protein